MNTELKLKTGKVPGHDKITSQKFLINQYQGTEVIRCGWKIGNFSNFLKKVKVRLSDLLRTSDEFRPGPRRQKFEIDFVFYQL